MENYICEICGKKHEIFTAIEIPIPERILEISDEEKESRVKKIRNAYIIDKEIILIKGDVFIYLKDEKEPFFTWSVWASFSFKNFVSKNEELKSGKNVEFDGELETELPFYKKTKGLKVKVIININYDYSIIKIEEESQIKIDQTNGVTKERVIAIMQMIHHNENRVKFDKSFNERLEEGFEM